MLGLMLHFQDRVQCSVLCLSLNLPPFPFRLAIPGEYMKLRVLCQSFINIPQLVPTVIAMRVVVSFSNFCHPWGLQKKNLLDFAGNYANFADRPGWIRSHCERIWYQRLRATCDFCHPWYHWQPWKLEILHTLMMCTKAWNEFLGGVSSPTSSRY